MAPEGPSEVEVRESNPELDIPDANAAYVHSADALDWYFLPGI
jgi:hypothetical protein